MSERDPRTNFRVRRTKNQPVMHPDKTAQDSMPVDHRPRVQAANARRAARG